MPFDVRRVLWAAVASLVVASSSVAWIIWDRSHIHQEPVPGDLLVGQDGRTLTAAVWWTGCEDRPKLTAHETSQGVTVSIDRRRHALLPSNAACDDWQEAYVSAGLNTPLGERAMSSAVSRATITPFAVGSLCLPANLPVGYVAAEAPIVPDHSLSPYTRGPAPAWTTTYVRDRAAGGDAGSISISQAVGEAPDQSATPVTVNGHAGRLRIDPMSRFTLDWSADGYVFTLRVMDRKLTEKVVLQLAEHFP
jgi:hypothetical protein